MKKQSLAFSIACLIGLSPSLLAQGPVGTLNGTVLDSASAVVPGATVVVTNQETKVENRTTTTSAGAYTLPYLPAGTYTIRVSSPGFRTSSAENVVLRVAQTLTVNMTLELGQVSEQVTVSAETPLLESGTAEIGHYISEAEYKSWPIIVSDGQRQIQSFIFSSLPGTTGDTFQGSINGGQQYSHEILIEGIPVGRMDLSGGNNNEFSPSAEAVGEFKLQTGSMGAQYNGGQTAVANFAIKSGTNDLHGSGFYYLQNEALNSASVATNSLGTKKSPFRQNNGGYSLGGPVYIPKLYNGKNKTFFFTNYEKTHYSQFTLSGLNTTLPTDDFRKGDFSRLLNPAFTGNVNSGKVLGTDPLGRQIIFGQIYDPLSTRTLPNGTVVRDPFAGNVIPQSRWNPVARNVIEKVGIVEPQVDRMVRNTPTVGTCCPYFDEYIFMAKIDHVINDKHRISGLYNHEYRNRNNSANGRYLPVDGSPTGVWQNQYTPGRMVRLSWDATVTPTVLNRLAAGYNRFGNLNQSTVVNQDWATKIGVQNTSAATFPVMNFRGNEWQGGSIGASSRFGSGNAGGSYNGSYVVQDDVTWIRGKHSVRFGYNYTRYYYNERNLSGSGNFVFSPVSTDLPGYSNETGHAFASFLLGAVNNADRGVYTLNGGFRQPYHALYVADDWKITPRLTMNLGMRWEIIPSFYERTERMSLIDLSVPNPGANNRPGALVFRNAPQDTNWKQFAPRIGLAYQASNKMVIRGGYGINNTPPIRNDWGFGGFTFGYNGSINVRAGTSPTGFVDDPAMYLDKPFPSFQGALPNTDPASANFTDSAQATAKNSNRLGYVQNWNVTIQYALPGQSVFEIAYVGNKGTRLWNPAFGNLNALPSTLLSLGDVLRETVGQHPEYKPYASYPNSNTVAQALRPYPQYTAVQEAYPYNSGSLYNSLQLTFTRHLTKGIGILGAYTWSKALAYNDSNGPMGSFDAQDVFNRSLERSVTSYNYPHVAKFTWVLETPVGKGKRFDLGFANYIVGDWQLSAVHNYRSGGPIQVYQSGINSPEGFGTYIRPDLTGQPLTLSGAPDTVDFFTGTPYLNPAAFRPSPHTGNGVPLRVGTAPRFLEGVRGPHGFSEDFRMAKYFPLHERLRLGVGGVFVNVFNRSSRDFASTNISDSNFGRLVATGGGRTVQLEARVEW